MKVTLRLDKGLLYPFDDESADYLLAPRRSGVYVVDLVKNRNPLFHRRAFVMMTKLHEMADIEIAFNPWRKWLLIQTGYCTTTGFPDGSVLVEPESMTFEKMDQEKFETVWRDLHQKFCQIYGDKMTYDQLTEWSVM